MRGRPQDNDALRQRAGDRATSTTTASATWPSACRSSRSATRAAPARSTSSTAHARADRERRSAVDGQLARRPRPRIDRRDVRDVAGGRRPLGQRRARPGDRRARPAGRRRGRRRGGDGPLRAVGPRPHRGRRAGLHPGLRRRHRHPERDDRFGRPLAIARLRRRRDRATWRSARRWTAPHGSPDAGAVNVLFGSRTRRPRPRRRSCGRREPRGFAAPSATIISAPPCAEPVRRQTTGAVGSSASGKRMV